MHKIGYLSFSSNKIESKLKKIFSWVLPIHKFKEYLQEMDLELWTIEVPFCLSSFKELKQWKRKILLKRVKKILKKKNIADVIVQTTSKEKYIKNEVILELKDTNIYDGKFTMLEKLSEILELISKMSNKDVGRYRVGILGRNITDIENTDILNTDYVRFLNVFLDDKTNLENYVEDIYNEYGLLIDVMPTEKALIGNSDIIINLLDIEVKTKSYNIFINIGDSTLSNSCKGIIINDIILKSDIESATKEVIESSGFAEFLIRNNVENNYLIQGFKGINGRITSKEFIKKNK